jgi:hypothetical protein
VDFFSVIAWVLVIVIAVTVIWPLNIPLMALAWKVRQGTQKLDLEPSEFWWRCTFAALGLAALTLLVLGLSYGLIVEVELDKVARGPVHLVLLSIFLVAGTFYLFWMLALEDFFQALTVIFIYLLLPGLPLVLLGWLFGVGKVLSDYVPWLLPAG